MKPRLVIVSDFAVASGFSRVAESLAAELDAAWDIAVLALGYLGTPHPLQARYRLYPAQLGGDPLGIEMLANVVRDEQPAVILVISDPWIVPQYLAALPADHAPVVAYCPVDGPHLKPIDIQPLNQCAAVIAYTEFGAAELRRAGYDGLLPVIPHGIDATLFCPPTNRATLRARVGIDPAWFVILVLDRNQPRKNLDIAFDGFARFAHTHPNARLLYHGGVRDVGWDLEDLAHDCGIAGRLILTGRHYTARVGIAVERLPDIYGACDVRLSTTAGEGWGLTIMEAMACGVPCIVPEWAALAEWPRGAVRYLPIRSTRRNAGMLNTTAGIVDPDDVAFALADLATDRAERQRLSQAGRALVEQPRFRWPVIASHFDDVLRTTIDQPRLALANGVTP